MWHGFLRKENYLTNRMVCIKPSTSYIVYKPEFALPHMHMHDFVELSMVISGSGIHYSLDGYAECHPGDVYVINEGTPHAYFLNQSGQEMVVQNVIFSPCDILGEELGDPDHPRYCCGIFRENPMLAHVVLSPDFIEEAKRIIDRIEKEQARKWLEWQVSVKAHLLDLLIMCSRRISVSADNNVPSGLPKLRDRQIALATMRTVLERYGDAELSLAGIATTEHISKANLSRIFQQVTGMRFSDFVSNVRIENACRYLLESNMTNEQICYACGFRDLPNFYRFFRRHLGVTPLAYRKSRKSL